MSFPVRASVILGVLAGAATPQDLAVPYVEHVLDNGLTLLVHEDKSDPVVAVHLVYHVGSGREAPGRSGFAHLFEHMLFQGSANVGDDAHFKLVTEAGGSLNGTTNRDRTLYFETLPSHQLELALWLEADRMGFLLPAMTQEKLDNQREVVKNERRQNYENAPYGEAEEHRLRALYPADHPYSWTTIGTQEDLSAATMEDVIGFFQRWYGPNNATLAVGGDVDSQQVIALVEKWFGSIPRGPEVDDPGNWPVSLEQEVRLVLEDDVQLAQLSFTWAGVPDGHFDEAALTMLGQVLSANKASVLDKALTVDATLASRVSARHDADELAGEFTIEVRATPGGGLDELELAVRELLAGLVRDGVPADRLERLKARHEAQTVSRYETVSARTRALAESRALTGNPTAFLDELAAVLAVTPEQVVDVAQRYLLEAPAVVLSVVPEGRFDLRATGMTRAQLAAEAALDRASRPAPGPAEDFSAPVVWRDELDNGLAVVGVPYAELPMVSLQLSIPGGQLRESLDTLGLSALTARLMSEGTADLDAVALQEALDGLGATLWVGSSEDDITLSLRVLQRNLPPAVALLGDVLLRPRFADGDVARIKKQVLAGIESRGDRIAGVAGNVWRRLQHGDATPAGWPEEGTLETVSRLDAADVRAFHGKAAVPDGARLVVVGDLDAAAVRRLLAPLVDRWQGGQPAPQVLASRSPSGAKVIYLVDKPGSPQSQIRVGHPGLSALDPDYYPFLVMNHVLGGSFSSRINMNLREDKGYTYGARSSLNAGLRPGTFTVSTAVRTDVTAPALAEIVKELQSITDGLTEEEVAFAKESLAEALNRSFESMGSLSSMADNIARYGWPDDYPEQRAALLRTIDKERLDELAREYVRLGEAAVLVVGDAAAIRKDLEALGLGEIVELDIDGEMVGVRM